MEKLTLDDMTKALKCVASQDTVGDCYADHENFMHMHDKHKRIICGTGEDLRDYIGGKEAVGCPYHQNTYGCCFEDGELYWLKDVAELLEELKSYKDLEEQGLLMRLPCKVGDTVYYTINNRILEVDVNLFFLLLSVAEGRFGRTVFLAREEAVNKLEDMNNGKK